MSSSWNRVSLCQYGIMTAQKGNRISFTKLWLDFSVLAWTQHTRFIWEIQHSIGKGSNVVRPQTWPAALQLGHRRCRARPSGQRPGTSRAACPRRLQQTPGRRRKALGSPGTTKERGAGRERTKMGSVGANEAAVKGVSGVWRQSCVSGTGRDDGGREEAGIS